MKEAIAVLLSFVLVVPVGALGQESGIVRRPLPPCELCRKSDGSVQPLSQAVVLGTFTQLRSLNEKLQAGQARSNDVQAVVTSLQVLFAHLDETGMTKAIEQSILSKGEEIIRYTPTRADAELIQNRHAQLGIKTTTEEEFQILSSSTVNDRMTAIARIKNEGMKSFYSDILLRFQGLQTKLAKTERLGRPQLKTVDTQGCNDYALAAAIMAVPCVFGCAGCCLVAAVAKLAYEICMRTGGNF